MNAPLCNENLNTRLRKLFKTVKTIRGNRVHSTSNSKSIVLTYFMHGPFDFSFLTLEQCHSALVFNHFSFLLSWYSEHYGVFGPVHFIPNYGVNNTGGQLNHSRDHCSLRAKLLWSHLSIICHLFGPLNVRLLKERFVT